MKKENTQLERRLPAGITFDNKNAYLRETNGFMYPPYGIYYEDEDGINLIELLQIIRKRIGLALLITIVATALTATLVMFIKPWYSSSTVIEIAKRNSVLLTNEGPSDQYHVIVNTSKLVLESPELYEEVIDELELVQNKIFLKRALGVARFLDFSGKSYMVEKAARGELTNDEQQFIYKKIVKYLKENTKTVQVAGARALQVSFAYEEPVLAARITNTIADVFIRRRFSHQTERLRNSADWLKNSTSEFKKEVQEAENNLAAYMRKNNIYETSSQLKNSTLTTSKLVELHSQYLQLQSRRSLAQSLYDQVMKGRVNELPDAFADQKIVALQKLLNEKKASKAELSVKFGAKNPKMIEVNNQVDSLTRQYKENLDQLTKKFRTDYERALKDEQSIVRELASAKSEALKEDQAFVQLNILRQEVKTKRALYNDFLQKTNQASARIVEQNENIRVIQRARAAEKPDGPKTLLITFISFILSFTGGLVFVYLREKFDETIKSVDDIERYGNLSVLGIVPSTQPSSERRFGIFKNKRAMDVQEDTSHLDFLENNTVVAALPSVFKEASMAAEAYNSLRTSLLLSSAESPPKTILFTSSLPEEGKTTTAINTAISLTKLGLKVLIIDCDLRRPTVHEKLTVSSASGLTNYLSGNESNIHNLIQKLSIPNLSVIASGPITPNPTEFLSSEKMNSALKTLYDDFDHIILDSPSINKVADPTILSTIVDGVVLVVRSRRTTRDIFRRSCLELYALNCRVLGAVLNDMEKESYD